VTTGDEGLGVEPVPPGAHPLLAGPLAEGVDLDRLTVLRLTPTHPLSGYLDAMAIAGREATERLAEPMLLSWYDRDRDFESPRHASECHTACATPGYVDYGIHHGATLMLDFEAGRFVFFYLAVES
jgi:hypothetical protein